MATIYKYTLEIEDHQEIVMPSGAELLTAQMQNGVACLWALVDPVKVPEKRGIVIRGTGHEISGPLGKYIATFQLGGGRLIFHVFEASSSSTGAK